MKILKITFILLVIVQFAILFSDIITETAYSDPALDGYIHFSQNAQAYSVNNWMYDMMAGDTWGVMPINPDHNSNFRSYLSFDLPEIPASYHVDSVYICVYQYLSGGYDASTGDYTDFPVWDLAGGDTIKCILSHIDYGDELDVDDWVKGDIGNQFTYQNNVGTVTESGDIGYRFIDVTASVTQDYEFNRDKSQYRIAFQVETDWDDWDDSVGFITANSAGEQYRPTIFIQFTDEISSIQEQEIPFTQQLTINILPNPVKCDFSISLSQKDILIEKVEIFNVKGQKVKSVNCLDSSNNSMCINCSNTPSGIYFLKVSSGIKIAVGKFLIMK